MNRKITVLIILVLFLNLSCTNLRKDVSLSGNEKQTADLYQTFIDGEEPNVAALNMFLTLMPKGGDIHHHYSGTLYAETYLDWVEESEDKAIDKTTFKIVNKNSNNAISVRELRANDDLYRKLLTLWSDKDFKNHSHEQGAPDQSFFNTFGYFGSIATCEHKGLEIIKERAISENVSYIETMLKAVGYPSKQSKLFKLNRYDQLLREAKNYTEISALLETIKNDIDNDPDFKAQLSSFENNLKNIHEGIDNEEFIMRYQTYVSRNSDPTKVFAGLYAAYISSKNNNLIVGVNIVGPENGITAIEDYSLHMNMFKYLNEKVGGVNIAMHAGELTLGMVRPENLTFHISEAINIANAKRIGHGVDLPYEGNPLEIIKNMKNNNIVLELNLTSNDFILGVKDKEHPYSIYAANNIPIVVCTDDSGISRNNLSNEYSILARRYKPDYSTLKQYAFNSIKYSFLSSTDKEKLKTNLENRFNQFENNMSKYKTLQ